MHFFLIQISTGTAFLNICEMSLKGAIVEGMKRCTVEKCEVRELVSTGKLKPESKCVNTSIETVWLVPSSTSKKFGLSYIQEVEIPALLH